MRLFIAIKLPNQIKDQIIDFQNTMREVSRGESATCSFTNGIKWVGYENLHLTLKFLGTVDEEQVAEVTHKISSAIHSIKPFHISLSTFGGFPDLRRPKVLWIGIKEGRQILIEIMNRLDKELSVMGFEIENRNPVPHLTIGRVKKVPPIKCKEQDFESPTFLADAVYLIKSDLTSQGPTYTDIKELKL